MTPATEGCATSDAGDFILGLIGLRAEAEQIKTSLETFLRATLKLELSREKTLITHATSQAVKFLGYELINQKANDQLDSHGTRKVNGQIGLRVPAKVIEQHCQSLMVNGKPARRNLLIHDEDYTIVDRYQAKFRGVVQYYLLAHNVAHLGKLQWVMERWLAHTLAGKHKATCRKVFRSYKSTIPTDYGSRKCLKVVKGQGEGKRPLLTWFGGIPLKRNRQSVLADQQPQRYRTERNEVVKRLHANQCEMCGSKEDVQVHHVRALRDLNVMGQRAKPNGFKSWRRGDARPSWPAGRVTRISTIAESNPRKQQ